MRLPAFACLSDPERGATALEFALIAPVLLLLVFGGIEGGRLLLVRAALQHGIGHAGRCVSISPDACATSATVAATISDNMRRIVALEEVAAEDVVLARAPCGLRISVSLPYRPLLLRIDQSLTIRAETCARIA